MNKKIHFSLSITILVKIVALHFLLYICSFDFDFVKQIAFTEVFSFRLFCFQIHPFLKKRKKKKAREDVICKVFLIGWQVWNRYEQMCHLFSEELCCSLKCQNERTRQENKERQWNKSINAWFGIKSGRPKPSKTWIMEEA